MLFWENGNRQDDHKLLTDLVVLSNTSSSTGSKRSSYEFRNKLVFAHVFETHES